MPTNTLQVFYVCVTASSFVVLGNLWVSHAFSLLFFFGLILCFYLILYHYVDACLFSKEELKSGEFCGREDGKHLRGVWEGVSS